MGEQQTANISLKSVGVTAVMLLDVASDSKPRQSVYIRNSSTAGQVLTIVLGDSIPIVSGTGYVYNPTGHWAESKNQGYDVWQGRIWGIMDAAAGSVVVVER